MLRASVQLYRGLTTLAICLWLVGCQSAARRQLAGVARFEAGEPTAAMAEFDEAAESRGAEAEIIAVDRAIAALMAGDVETSESELRKTRRQMEFLAQKDAVEQTRSVLTDDKSLAWSGREFERRMVDNLLVFASLLGNRQDAFAYSTQVMEQVAQDRQQLQPAPSLPSEPAASQPAPKTAMSQPPGPRHAANAFAAYLSAGVRSEHMMDSDLTDRAIQQVGFWRSGGTLKTGYSDVTAVTAGFGTQTRRQHGTLHVVTFAGRITDWTAETAAPTSGALLIADRILSAVGDHTLPPTVAPVLIARPKIRTSQHPFTTAIRIQSPGVPPALRTSATLVDLNAAAWDSYQHDRNEQIARAVARRIIKKGAVYTAKNQLSVNSDTGVDVLLNLGGVLWEAMEKPDTRHIDLLPERIETVQLELPVGTHTVEVASILRSSAHAASFGSPAKAVEVSIDDGRNTFVVCFRPSDQSRELHIVTSQ